MALDTPRRLKDSVAGYEVIEAELAEAPASWHEARAALPAVVSVTEHEKVTHIASKNGPQILSAVMNLAWERGVDVRRVAVQNTTPDDVFLHFTGRQLRDELGSKRLEIGHLYK